MHAETCLATMEAAAVVDTRAERDDIHGVVEAMPVASEEDSLVPAMEARGGEGGKSSLTQIELDGQARKVFGESADEQEEQEEKIRCSENPHQPVEGSSRMAGRLPNSDDLAGIVQVEAKVWTP